MAQKVLVILVGVVTLWLSSEGLCPALGEAGGQQEIKIGFISLMKLSQESLKRKAFEEEIIKMLEEKRDVLDGMRREIADLETAKALSGPEQARIEEQKIQQKEKELAKFRDELRREVAKRRLAFDKELLKDISEAVKEVAEEKGYTWVLLDDILAYKDESADLTFQTLVKMNDKYLSTRSKPEVKPAREASSARGPLPVAVEDALIEDVLKNGVRDRYTIKEILPRSGGGSTSGSITMKREGGGVRFVPQYPKDMTAGRGGVVSTPMGNKSVWRFVGEVALSGYTFNGLDEKRPLTFILLEEIGLVHLYGTGSVTFPDGRSVPIEDKKLPAGLEGPATELLPVSGPGFRVRGLASSLPAPAIFHTPNASRQVRRFAGG